MNSDKREYCYACGNPASDLHHYILRRHLTKREQGEARYMIPLCRKCHTCVHFDTHNSGLGFYELHGIVDKVSARCGYDPRWMMWIERQKAKHGNI